MVRTSAMYYDRLRIVLDKCLRIGMTLGVVSVDVLASELGLGERILREYLRDLVALGVLEYLGAGKYRVDIERINAVTRLYDTVELKITDFFDEGLIREIRASKEIEDRISRVFKKFNFDFLLSPQVKEKIERARVDSSATRIRGARIVGDRLIVRRVARRFPLDDVYIGGSGYDYRVVDKILFTDIGEPFAVLTLAFVSAVSNISYFSGDLLDESKSKFFYRPAFETYGGRSPFVRGEPFYELVTSYPDLLDFARRLAARLIAQKVHYEAIMDALDASQDVELFVVGGSLFPHGFVLRSKKLLALKREVEELFDKLIKKAKKRGVILAGTNFRPHDDIWLRFAKNILGVRTGHLNDTNALLFLLDDGDTTVLINRFKERGRERLDEWYEFYLKVEGRVLKIEFISLGNPIEEYVKVRDYIYSLCFPSPSESKEYGPTPVLSAISKARARLRVFSESIVNIIDFRFKTFVAEMARRGI